MDLFSLPLQSQYDRLRSLGWVQVAENVWQSPGNGRFTEDEALKVLERHERENHDQAT